MQRVSRAWKDFIRGSYKRYTCLDFLVAKRAIPESSLQAYSRRSASGGGVQEAVLSRFTDDSTLSALVHQCQQLSTLRIYRSGITPDALSKEVRVAQNLTSLIADLQFSVDSFCEILEGCASLRAFECRGIICAEPIKPFTANLRRLKVREGCNAPPVPLDRLLVSRRTLHLPLLWRGFYCGLC